MMDQLFARLLAAERQRALNRWRAATLRRAAAAVGEVLDFSSDLPERVRDDLRNALAALVWWELDFAEKGGKQ